MKLSKVMHIASIVAGLVGVITFTGALIGGSDNLVLGITKIDALLCAGILILIAIWFVLGSMHHMILEKKGELV